MWNRTPPTLRVAYSLGNEQLTIARTGNFLDHTVPMDFSLGQGGAIIARAKVSEMAAFTPTAEFFTPQPDLKPAGTGIARISSGVMAGLRVAGEQPVMPASAGHIHGAVILHAIIGRNGHVRWLRPMSAPSSDLAIAVLAAARTWRYRPYLLNGFPTVVDTSIVVQIN